MLRHENKEKFEDFIWHWFLVIGYRLEMYKDFLKLFTDGKSSVTIGREINEKEIV